MGIQKRISKRHHFLAAQVTHKLIININYTLSVLTLTVLWLLTIKFASIDVKWACNETFCSRVKTNFFLVLVSPCKSILPC